MAISIGNIVKQSAKFNVVSIISLLIQIPTKVIIGIFLIPEEFGVISFVLLWKLYAGLINPGMLSTAQREIPYLMGKKEEKQSLRVQNISISSDLLYSILPFSVILCASTFYSNQLIRIGLILIAISFLFDRFVDYWVTMNFIKQNFTVVAMGRLIGAISSPVIILGSIYWLGIYAVLIAPLFCTISMGIYYLRKGSIGYYFQFEWTEVIRLIKIGYVLSLLGVMFYVYRMTDRIIIASFLSLHDLGIFAFPMVFIMYGVSFLADFGRVLKPILWKQSGEVENPEDFFNNTKKMAIYMALVSAMIIPLVQIGYVLTVRLLLSKYIESIPLFLILSNMLYLTSIAIIPSIILNSVVVNKQVFVTGIYAIGAGINIVLDLLMIFTGHGIEAIAFVTIISQGIVAYTSYFLAKKYMSTLRGEFARFVVSISVPFFISILLSIAHSFQGSTTLSPWLFGLLSLVIQIVVWSFILNVFYHDYFPRDKVVNFAKELYGLGVAGIRRQL